MPFGRRVDLTPFTAEGVDVPRVTTDGPIRIPWPHNDWWGT